MVKSPSTRRRFRAVSVFQGFVEESPYFPTGRVKFLSKPDDVGINMMTWTNHRAGFDNMV